MLHLRNPQKGHITIAHLSDQPGMLSAGKPESRCRGLKRGANNPKRLNHNGFALFLCLLEKLFTLAPADLAEDEMPHCQAWPAIVASENIDLGQTPVSIGDCKKPQIITLLRH